jgi:general stress protein CsbA
MLSYQVLFSRVTIHFLFAALALFFISAYVISMTNYFNTTWFIFIQMCDLLYGLQKPR